MSSPIETIYVRCSCGTEYLDEWRPSMNLSIDDFDRQYIEKMSSTTCPNCHRYTRFGTLTTHFENDHLSMQFEGGVIVPKDGELIFPLNSAEPAPNTKKSARRRKRPPAGP
jgi:hypothetical protein